MKLAGVSFPHEFSPCFGIPIFVEGEAYFVQETAANGTISSFTRVDSPGFISPCARSGEQQVGDEALYACRLSDADVVIGQRSLVAEALYDPVLDTGVSLAFRVDAAEFLGESKLHLKYERELNARLVGLENTRESVTISNPQKQRLASSPRERALTVVKTRAHSSMAEKVHSTNIGAPIPSPNSLEEQRVMRTLLCLIREPSLGSAIEEMLDPTRFQVVFKQTLDDAIFVLSNGAFDAVILELELTDANAIRVIEDVKRFAPHCPVMVISSAKQRKWEEDAYLLGVQVILEKPISEKLFNALLLRLFPNDRMSGSGKINTDKRHKKRGKYLSRREPTRAMEVFRRFSGLLAHALQPEELLQHFLQIVSELMGVNRALIFLSDPCVHGLGGAPSQENRWLRPSCAIGLDMNVLIHFALSVEGGIGGYLQRHRSILHALSPEAQSSREIMTEFQLLGASVAVPILDADFLMGVALLGPRLSGKRYSEEELALIFNLVDQVGLAVRNAWSHSQLQAQHAMVSDILGALGTGCLVIGSDLATLHSNAAASEILLHDRPAKMDIGFYDLPQHLGSLAFGTIKDGTPQAPFKYQFDWDPDRWFRICILPFVTHGLVKSSAALLVLEDVTEHEKATRLEVEASNLRIVRSMAEHLAHDIGNSLVPISTHQQLLKDSINDPEFQESLSDALSVGVRRISRLANQMVFLAQEWTKDFPETVSVSDLIVEAFDVANSYHPGKKMARLAFNKEDVEALKISGDHKALRHAFSEIILNAIQANSEDPRISVSLREKKGESPEIQVEVKDRGKGFTKESASRATEPFFSTRNVGAGIGLTVTRKIIEDHRGRVEIPYNRVGESKVVRVSLPLRN